MKLLLTVVAALATTCVLFGAPPCYKDANGNVICPEQAAPSFVWSTPAPAKVAAVAKSSDCNCAPCTCAPGAGAVLAAPTVFASGVGQSYAMNEQARRVLFPRVSGFISTVVERRQARLANVCSRGILMRFRR